MGFLRLHVLTSMNCRSSRIRSGRPRRVRRSKRLVGVEFAGCHVLIERFVRERVAIREAYEMSIVLRRWTSWNCT